MTKKHNSTQTVWFVYLVRTAAGVLYTGITTDPVRRLTEHQGNKKGSRMLRGKGPLELVFQQEAGTRSKASKIEYRIKQFSKEEKLRLIADNEGWAAVLEAVQA